MGVQYKCIICSKDAEMLVSINDVGISLCADHSAGCGHDCASCMHFERCMPLLAASR